MSKHSGSHGTNDKGQEVYRGGDGKDYAVTTPDTHLPFGEGVREATKADVEQAKNNSK